MVALAEYHSSGVDIDLTNLTLKELFDRWLEEQDKRNISYSAKRGHYIAYNRLDKLANMPVTKIKTIHLQKWMDGIDLKPGTKNKIKTLFHFILSLRFTPSFGLKYLIRPLVYRLRFRLLLNAMNSFLHRSTTI